MAGALTARSLLAVTPLTQLLPFRFERRGGPRRTSFVARALRSQGLWLTVTYLFLLLLMSRAYS
jgi:hypothetical protein